MAIDEKKLIDTVSVIFEKLLEKENDKFYAHLERVREEYQKLAKESERLNSRVEKLLGEPTCPTCGRRN